MVHRDLNARLESLLESKNLKINLKRQVEKISQEFEEKYEKLQRNNNEECDNHMQRTIFYDLDNINPVYCGLGCQLHGFSAAFVCSSENHRKLEIINFQRSQYENYLEAFKTRCKHEDKSETQKILKHTSIKYYLL